MDHGGTTTRGCRYLTDRQVPRIVRGKNKAAPGEDKDAHATGRWLVEVGDSADETERDLHRTGLCRMLQPPRVGGADLDVGIIVDTCAAIARVCPSTAWNLGNLASHHWMLGYYQPAAQEEIWDISRDTLIATSLAFPAGRGRKVDGGYEVSGRWPLSSGVDNSDWNMLAFIVRERDDGPPVDQRFALVHRSQYEIIDTWHAVGLSGTGSKDVATRNLFVPEYRTLTAWALNGKPHPGSARKRNATTTGQPVGASVTVQIKVAKAGAHIDTAEMMMRAVCSHAMEIARAGREPRHEDELRYRRDAFFSVRLCLEAVNILMTV
ncbi:MAG: hypothetical protein EPO50_08785 [Reyranella sp.]|nr:MAG: hypothetical protein EPO50_08785 [Reyranella sp.]